MRSEVKLLSPAACVREMKANSLSPLSQSATFYASRAQAASDSKCRGVKLQGTHSLAHRRPTHREIYSACLISGHGFQTGGGPMFVHRALSGHHRAPQNFCADELTKRLRNVARNEPGHALRLFRFSSGVRRESVTLSGPRRQKVCAPYPQDRWGTRILIPVAPVRSARSVHLRKGEPE